METSDSVLDRHVAVGPDGTNLLGFLAAVGSLSLLSAAWPQRSVRLGWTMPPAGPGAGHWCPVLHMEPAVSRGQLVAALTKAVQTLEGLKALDGLDDNLRITRQELRQAQRTARSGARQDRRAADLLAALSIESQGHSKDEVDRSPLQALTGAGHQDFLKTLRELSKQIGEEHIHRALFQPWSYEDQQLTFRWDPADFRPYALRARNPSKDRVHPIRTEWGANRLAFEALALFCMVWGREPGCVGFRGEELRWPLWWDPVTLPVVRSLLSHPALFEDTPSRLAGLGVCAVVSSRKFTSGKGYVNFGPSRLVWTAYM